MTIKPHDFESDIHEAADEGKLTSVQYLVEQCHANVEAKGYTHTHWAFRMLRMLSALIN